LIGGRTSNLSGKMVAMQCFFFALQCNVTIWMCIFFHERALATRVSLNGNRVTVSYINLLILGNLRQSPIQHMETKPTWAGTCSSRAALHCNQAAGSHTHTARSRAQTKSAIDHVTIASAIRFLVLSEDLH
jgi:hypothetical protein